MSAISHLSDQERSLLRAIVELFFEEVNGYAKKITNDQVLFRLAERGHHIEGAAFRRYLAIIRRHNSCRKYLLQYQQRDAWAFIISSNEGYWWSEDLNELREFWESMHERGKSIMMSVKPLYLLFGFSEEQLRLLFPEDEESESERAA
ncbi:MAG: hypothetical protein EOP50_11895 [Sphingobacteriales bacterium]|nr:MAG: hypothetical protein EOP50_11895 [Sphingobacteriales bacterium]